MADGKFVKNLSDSEYEQFLKGCRTLYSYVNTAIVLFGGSEDRFNRLESAILDQSQGIGKYIIKQIDQLTDVAECIANEQAVAKAEVVEKVLHTYDTSTDEWIRDASLANADLVSAEAVELFFSPSTGANPLCLGGFIIAGTIRMVVIRAINPFFFNDPVRVAEINRLCEQLDAMIRQVKESVNAAHVVRRDSNPVYKPVHWYAHFHQGTMFEIFRFSEQSEDDADSREKAAEQAAQARAKGVQAELNFLKIPDAEDCLRKWKAYPKEWAKYIKGKNMAWLSVLLP